MRTLLSVLLPAKLLLWITSQTLWECSHAISPLFVGPRVRGLCQAQCLSWCYDLGPKCDFKCEGPQDQSVIPGNVVWKVNCSKTWGYYYMECVGTCSIISFEERGYIPAKPDVYVFKNGSSYTLLWQPDIYVTPNTVYVVSQLERVGGIEEWHNIGMVKGGQFHVGYVDICAPPVFRVAAVNRYGSRWYSNRTAPVNVPGPPRNICFVNMEYDNYMKQIRFVLHWNDPIGWKSDEIDPKHEIKTSLECRPTLDTVFMMKEKESVSGVYVVGSKNDTLTYEFSGLFSENAIGCTVKFQISARSICHKTCVGTPAHYSMKIKCSNVKGYNGSFCQPPPVLQAGQVSHLKLALIWLYNGIMGLVSWQPPKDLGSAGRVAHYHIFYGIVDLKSTSLIKTFQGTPEHKVVNGNTFSVDIFSNITTLKSFETIGVVVRAAAPGQSFKRYPGGAIVCANNALHPMHTRAGGRLITDDDTIIVVASSDNPGGHGQSGVGVQVFWRRPNETMALDIANYAVEMGALKSNNNSAPNGLEDFEPPTINRTTTEGDENFIEFDNLLPVTKYGIKIIPLYKNTTVFEDLQEETWHFFTTPEGDESISKSTVTVPIHFVTHERSKDKNTTTIVVATVCTVVIMVLLGFITHRVWHQKRFKRCKPHYVEQTYRHYSLFGPGDSLEASQASSQPGLPRVVDEWQLPLTGLKLGPLLGSGAFGKVVKGRVSRALLEHRGLMSLLDAGELYLDMADPCHVTVAVKMLQDNCDTQLKQDFLKEIELMKRIGHHRHVVSMLGCCTMKDPLCLVVEHQANGDLLTYLKAVRQQVAPIPRSTIPYVNENPELCSSLDLLNFGKQIALGMEFLSSKGYIHRDLAARNVLMDSSRQCKIGDFGLARLMYDDLIYVNRKGGRLPIKWMSIEAIFDQSFSTASDVWSFGIVLFEIVTLGGTPYPTIPSQDLLKELQLGYRMDRPENCSQELYQIMLNCWKGTPSDRPSFKNLAASLEEMMAKDFGLNYITMNINPHKDVYQIEGSQIEDTSEEGTVSTPTHRMKYSRVTGNGTAFHSEITSDDSGYTTSKKSSVSSGESGTTATSTEQSGNENGGEEEHENSSGGASHVGQPKPITMTKRVSFNVQNELIDDDVFYEDAKTIPVKPSCEGYNMVVVDQNNDINEDGVVLSCLNRSNSDSKLFTGESDRRTYFKCKSDSDLVSDVYNKEFLKECVEAVVDSQVVLRHNKADSKKRRMAVTRPPTLVLDNNLYFQMDGRRIRQEPPATLIHRKRICPNNRKTENERTSQDKSCCLKHSVAVDVHQPPVRTTSDKTLQPIPTLTNQIRDNGQNTATVPSQKTSKLTKTFVKKDTTPASLHTRPIDSRMDDGNIINITKVSVKPLSHQYTDFNNILHKTAPCDDMVSNTYAAHRDTGQKTKKFDSVKKMKRHKRKATGNDMCVSHDQWDNQSTTNYAPVSGMDMHGNYEMECGISLCRVRNDSGLPKSPDEISQSSSSVENSDRKFFPQGRQFDEFLDAESSTCCNTTSSRFSSSKEIDASSEFPNSGVSTSLETKPSFFLCNPLMSRKDKPEIKKTEGSALVSEKHPHALYRIGKVGKSDQSDVSFRF